LEASVEAREIANYLPKTFLARQGESVAEVSARLDEATRRLRDRIERLSDERLHAPLAPGKWSPAEIVDHLVKINALLIAALSCADGEPLGMSRGRLREDGKPFSPEEGLPTARRAREALIKDLEAGINGILASIRDARESERLDKTCLLHGFLGPLNPLECLQLASWHLRHHLKQLPEEV
jgi:uncharacterized damage-inducible protein DinB